MRSTERTSERRTLEDWLRFIRARSHIFVHRPQLFFQEAFNFEQASPVQLRASELMRQGCSPRLPWLRRVGDGSQVLDPLLQTLEGHEAPVNAVAVGPDGREAVTASADGTVLVWDLATGACLRAMDIEGAGINVVVALAERARCGLTTSSDHTICVWDLETENWIRRLEGHNASVYALAATPDRTKALSGSQDGTIRIWDLGRLDHLLTLKSTRRERSWEP